MSIDRTNAALYQSEGLKLLYGNSVLGIIIGFIASGILTFTFATESSFSSKISWWLVMAVVLFLRLIDTLLWFRTPDNAKNFPRWQLRFSVGCLSTAAMWSAYGVLFFPSFSLAEFTSVVVILSALAGGATSTLSGNLTVAILYNLTILAPFSLIMLAQPETWKSNLGILGICSTAAMTLGAIRSSRYTQEVILLRDKNKMLVTNMEETIRRRTQQIYEMSHIDSLTGLYNRAAFLSAAEDICNQYRERHIDGFCIFFIDLDGFKNINDTLGHDIGDRVLHTLSARLYEFYRPGSLVCRWGGDEFIYLLVNGYKISAQHLGEEIVRSLSQPIVVDEQKVTLSATVGISVCPEHDTALTRLIQLADIAMYSQKGKYPERVAFYNLELEYNLLRKIALNEALKTALANDELRLVYQPIVDPEGRIVSFEALLRWHYQGSDISPAEFIPLMEQSGRIVEIGKWAMDEACRTLLTMQKHLPGVAMCVNISMIQFYDKEFVNNVTQLLSKHQLDGGSLHLEVTESIFNAELQVIYQKISALQQRGVRFSVDDFGTGYSSLSVIQNINVDYIKIDRSFIDNLDSKGLAIVEAVMSISEGLAFYVIAEGVETAKQQQKLIECGVHFMQGYYFSHPLEYSHALALLETSRQGITTA